MSRIGRAPIPIPDGVTVTVTDGRISVAGPKGTLERQIPGVITVREDGGQLLVERPDDERQNRAQHGLTRSLVQNMVLGEIATATFANPAGLVRVGDSSYSSSIASGVPLVGVPGVGSRGSLSAGALEMSNVDLAQEFTNMIIAERGFQANSRVITASDEMLQDLVNLKR